MDPHTFMDIATTVTKLKMYPYFDIANFVLMCMMVREDSTHTGDTQTETSDDLEVWPYLQIVSYILTTLAVRADFPITGHGSQSFSRRHPLACWVASMLLIFSGSIMANFLMGEPIITPFKNHEHIIVASGVWYLINYSPFDLVYKLARFFPIKVVIYVLKELQRTKKIYDGVTIASKIYPGSFVVIAIIGIVKGAGYAEMRMLERLIRGLWVPGSNEFLQPSFTSKASLLSAIIFILERIGILTAPHALIYFGVAMFLVYFRLSALLLGIHDPFIPFENLFCAVFMGGIWDAFKRAIARDRAPTDPTSNDVKRKEEKKND